MFDETYGYLKPETFRYPSWVRGHPPGNVLKLAGLKLHLQHPENTFGEIFYIFKTTFSFVINHISIQIQYNICDQLKPPDSIYRLYIAICQIIAYEYK